MQFQMTLPNLTAIRTLKNEAITTTTRTGTKISIRRNRMRTSRSEIPRRAIFAPAQLARLARGWRTVKP